MNKDCALGGRQLEQINEQIFKQISDQVFTVKPANLSNPGVCVTEDGFMISTVFRGAASCGMVLYHVFDLPAKLVRSRCFSGGKLRSSLIIKRLARLHYFFDIYINIRIQNFLKKEQKIYMFHHYNPLNI